MRKAPAKRPAAASKLPVPTQLVTFARDVPPVRRIPIALARRFTQICIASLAEAVASADLTPMQYGVLANLRDQPEIDQNSLAAKLGIDRNNTSVLVQQLVTRGLIARRVNGADRRARLLSLTPKGVKIHAEFAPATVASQQRILEVLTPKERDLLLDLLVRVIEANRVLARPGAGRRKRSRKPTTEFSSER